MLYAHSSRVRSRQIAADLALIAWILLWSSLGYMAFRVVNTLRAPSQKVADAATSLGSKVDGFQSSLPGFLKDHSSGLSTPANNVHDAANHQADAVTHVATVLGWSIALVPIVLGVLVAAYFRIRWMNRVRGVTKLATSPAWMELLANRAAMHQPLNSLARVSRDPLGDLADGNYSQLAQLELSELGINPAKVARRINKMR